MSNYCKCCYQELGENDLNCPRCGLTQFKIVGNDPAQVKVLESLIHSHRMSFLGKYELGVTCYYWKDQDGTIALDSKRTLTFGTAAELLEGTRWLDQEFARMPDDQEITVDLTVTENGGAGRDLQVRVTPPTEPQLQKLGLQLDKQLQLRLLVKNDKTTCTSTSVSLL